jgi:uncharacterized repeat protein (TIGR02543 family)
VILDSGFGFTIGAYRGSGDPVANFTNINFVNNSIVGLEGSLGASTLKTGIYISWFDIDDGTMTISDIEIKNNIISAAEGRMSYGSDNPIPAEISYGNNMWSAEPVSGTYKIYDSGTDTVVGTIPTSVIHPTDLSSITPADNDLTMTGADITGLSILSDYLGNARLTPLSSSNVGAIENNNSSTHILTVTKTGTGTVSSNPIGIDCGSDCSEEYTDGTDVTLTAAPATGSTFTGWSGDGCSGTDTTCTVTMDQARSVTADFALDTYYLTVTKSGTGTGTVSSNPVGIDCGVDCSENYDYDTDITLTAVAESGSEFIGWTGGGCSGTGTCVVSMTEARAVDAEFAEETVNYDLTVTKTGTGTGTVSSNPIGIDCGSDCSEEYTDGTDVTLTAAPATGSTFTGWSGDGCSGTDTTCTVTMDQARSVTADFALDEEESDPDPADDPDPEEENPEELTLSLSDVEESASNDGSIDELVVTLQNGQFDPDNINESTITLANLPEGIAYTVEYNNPQQITIHFQGTVSSHDENDDITDVVVNIDNTAIEGANEDISRTFSINFHDNSQETIDNADGNDSEENRSSYSSNEITTPGTPDLFQINVGSNSVTLYFSPINGENNYYISYGEGENTEGHGVEFHTDDNGVVTYTVKDLVPGQEYCFKVRGKNGNWSNVMCIKTLSGDSDSVMVYYKDGTSEYGGEVLAQAGKSMVLELVIGGILSLLGIVFVVDGFRKPKEEKFVSPRIHGL